MRRLKPTPAERGVRPVPVGRHSCLFLQVLSAGDEILRLLRGLRAPFFCSVSLGEVDHILRGGGGLRCRGTPNRRHLEHRHRLIQQTVHVQSYLVVR